MSIISLEFFVLFFLVFAVYYLLSKSGKAQNYWLLIVSYLFYGYTEWRMLPLLIIATLLFYVAGLEIAHDNECNERRASLWTTLSVVFGVGMLVYFKYLNFLIEGITSLLNLSGLGTGNVTLNILMPLGISFFTFRLIAYPIEVHRGHMEPCRDFVAFATYVAFFPTILSGPIDRPKMFIDQLSRRRTFDYNMAVRGGELALWGIFMKLCIADRLGLYTTVIDENFQYHNGGSIFLSSLLYPIQLYADFCGYSNVAIGVGSILGIKVAENFHRPFFAKNIAEYWRRWHVSLTGWLTDYVFMPLNVKFRDKGKAGMVLAVMINFVLIGMWHGADGNFLIFGMYHGLLYVPLILCGELTKRHKKRAFTLPDVGDIAKMAGTYLLVAIGLVIFRTASICDAWSMMSRIMTTFGMPMQKGLWDAVPFICLMMFYESREEFFADKLLFMEKRVMRWICYLAMFTMILLFGVFDGGQFIYINF